MGIFVDLDNARVYVYLVVGIVYLVRAAGWEFQLIS